MFYLGIFIGVVFGAITTFVLYACILVNKRLGKTNGAAEVIERKA